MTKSWKKLLKNKNFLYIWLSQIFSQMTINILNYSILFTLFEKTGSTIATSMVWIFYALPALLLGPFASALVDMASRKKFLVVTNLLQLIVIILYALSSKTSQFFIYAFVLIYSAVNQFYVPAEFATLPHVVNKNILPEANGLFLITQQGALVIGFGIAGILLKFLGFEFTLLLSALLMSIAFLSTLFLPNMNSKEKIPRSFEKAASTFLNNIMSGYRLIKENKFIFSPLIILICLQISLTIISVNAPAIARNIAKIPITYAGAFLVVPGGLGAMTASILISRLLKRGLRKIKIIKNSLFILFISLSLWVFLFSYLNDTFKIFLSFISIFIMGFSYIGILIPSQTLLQQKTPFNFRGRVFGNYWFLVTILSVFPVIFSGTISEIFGIRFLMVILIVGILGLYLFLVNKEKIYLISGDSKN